MNPAQKAAALAERGEVVEAARLLEDSARRGDGEAAHTLAHWRLSGALIRRDLKLARDWFGMAADLGIAEAEGMHVALLANGAGGNGRQWQEALARLRTGGSDDGRRQLALLEAMDTDTEGEPLATPPGEPLSDRPFVRRFPAFCTADECAYLIDIARPRLQPSVVIDPGTGSFVRDPVRRSSAAAFPFVLETPMLHALNRRIARASGTSWEQGEPTQILSYDVNEEYKLHSDVLPSGDNQRAWTFLVYLNGDYEGGHTVFPRAGLSFRGEAGDGLLFSNLADGRPDPYALHAGQPIVSGRKVLLSKWIRERPLDLAGPPGRPL